MEEPSAFDRWEEEKQIERFERFMADMAADFEDRSLEAAEESLVGVAPALRPGEAPPPLSWHPWYRDKSHLIDWLNDPDRWDYRIPMPRSRCDLYSAGTDATYPVEPSPKAMLLAKTRAWGPAPYVGRPFVYVWNVGTDEVGRQIAGESRIVYKGR